MEQFLCLNNLVSERKNNLMPIHTYSNWNRRHSDTEEQIEPYRKYFFICEGANTETFYFKKLIDLRKELNIHPLIDIRLWEKTGEDKDISFAKNLTTFAFAQKTKDNGFDPDRDKLIIVFDADIFEEKVHGYEELIRKIEKSDIAAVTNPSFELFLILHIENSFEQCILNQEKQYLTKDDTGSYRHAYTVLHSLTGMNAKKNPQIGQLAENVLYAISQEKKINQDIHNCKGIVTSNIGAIIESIMNEKPEI